MASSEERAKGHHGRHHSALSEWEIEADVDGFVSAQPNEVELTRVDYPDGFAAMHFRWDFKDLGGGKSICREAGVWVHACEACVQPRIEIPGTQRGRSRYPSKLYEDAIVGRPTAIFCFYGAYTRPVAAFESRELDKLTKIPKSDFEGARDNLNRLREYSRTALRSGLLHVLRRPRYVIDPPSQWRYPPPRLSPLLKRRAKIHWPDFAISANQFVLHLDDLDRDLALDEARFERGIRFLQTSSWVVHDRGIGERIYSGTLAIAAATDAGIPGVEMNEVMEANDDETERAESEEETIAAQEMDEEAQRQAEEEERQRVEAAEAEEEQRQLEEEEAAALYDMEFEEEEYYSRPSHDDCHWDEDRQQMVTDDGDPCPHAGD